MILTNSLYCCVKVASDQRDCTLVGYRRIPHEHERRLPTVELGTLSPVEDVDGPSLNEHNAETLSLTSTTITAPPGTSVPTSTTLLANSSSLPTLYTDRRMSDIVMESVAGAGSLPALGYDGPSSSSLMRRRTCWGFIPSDSSSQQGATNAMQVSSSSSGEGMATFPGDDSKLRPDTEAVGINDVTLCDNVDSGLSVHDTTLTASDDKLDEDNDDSPVQQNKDPVKVAWSLQSDVVIERRASDTQQKSSSSRDEFNIRSPNMASYHLSSHSVDQMSNTDASTSSSPALVQGAGCMSLSHEQISTTTTTTADDSGIGSQSEVSSRRSAVENRWASDSAIFENNVVTTKDAVTQSSDAVDGKIRKKVDTGDAHCAARLAELAKPEEFDDDDLDVQVYPDNELYLSEQCTILEMIKEEGERSRRKQPHHSDMAVIGERLAGGTLKHDTVDLPPPQPPINGVTLTSSDGSPSSSSSSNSLNRVGQIPNALEVRRTESVRDRSSTLSKLVQPVRDETVRFVSAKEMLRKQLKYTGHFYRLFHFHFHC